MMPFCTESFTVLLDSLYRTVAPVDKKEESLGTPRKEGTVHGR